MGPNFLWSHIWILHRNSIFNGIYLKLKRCGVLLSIDNIVSLKSLLTETTMSIDNKTPNSLSLCLAYQILKAQNMFCWYVTSKKVWPHFVGSPPPQLCHFASLHLPSIYQHEQEVPYKARVLEQRQSKSSSKMILELSCLLSPDLWCDPQTYLLAS